MIKKIVNNIINIFRKKERSFTQSEEDYYNYLFTQSTSYSKKEANEEEVRRWTEICKLLNLIPSVKLNIPLDLIVDFGCGRGWLTNYLSALGKVIGIEPVESVVRHGKSLYPELELICGSFEQLRTYKPELIVSSEVLEHIPEAEKQLYFTEMHNALKDNGFFLLTTPRKEVLQEWSKYTDPSQPIEEWLSGDEILFYALNAGFSVMDKLTYSERPTPMAPLIEVYQQWLFHKK